MMGWRDEAEMTTIYGARDASALHGVCLLALVTNLATFKFVTGNGTRRRWQPVL